jgi:F-type H+-transporting ATPase subunit epsilon
MKNFNLEIATPEKQVFSGSVQSVLVPGTMGSFQVLFNHAPIISTLGHGKVKVVKEDGEELVYYAQDGVIEVLNNEAIILLEKMLDK